MSEIPGNNFEVDDQYPIDRQLVVGRLQEYGIDIELEDLDDKDDADVMGIIVTYATMYDFDMDDILPQVTPIENRTKDDN